MYRRLIILSLIIAAALGGLSWLGYRAVSMWSQGIEGTRITEFADVAEQIRIDVNETLTAFMEQEKNRPYTDYQYYSISEEPFIMNQEVRSDGTTGRSVSNRNYRNNQALREQGNILNNSNQQVAVKVSPLADDIEHDLAYFNFQYDNTSKILTTPNGFVVPNESQADQDSSEKLNELLGSNLKNVEYNLIPVLEKFESKDISDSPEKKYDDIASDSKLELGTTFDKAALDEVLKEEEVSKKVPEITKSVSKGNTNSRTGNFDIQGLQDNSAEPLVQKQSREFVTNNVARNDWGDVAQQVEMINQYQYEQQRQRQSGLTRDESDLQQMPSTSAANNSTPQTTQAGRVPAEQSEEQLSQQMPGDRGGLGFGGGMGAGFDGGMGGFGGGMRGGRGAAGGMAGGRVPDDTRTQTVVTSDSEGTQGYWSRGQMAVNMPVLADPNQADIVEVIIEPFSTIVVPEENGNDSIFGSQVFMVRRVKYEGKELFQGFQLNEKKLLEKVEESTKRFVREGMSFELGRKLNGNSAYTAILDFGFGHLLLNLFEDDPGRFMAQISHLRKWYFSIIAVVFLAVTLAMISLWLNAREQIMLAQKKDDFVSAVSHELRTPLTSIRMHAEMLEKNWIKSEDKLGEYYRSMRTESERLTRLIENVLDFSRIQKGRKKYLFKLGDINKCVADVAEMMRAYAAQRGFQIQMQSGDCGEIAFDSDAVTQIVVNLIDNAVKYSSNSEDKTVTVRTKSDGQFVLIEVEDRGPGIPYRQRKKVFQEFYRIGAESTRETTGSGLGLALVKKFAQAHNGFVEIINARPTGAIFRVSLAAKLQNNI